MNDSQKRSLTPLIGIFVTLLLVGTLAAVIVAFYKRHMDHLRSKEMVIHYACAAGLITLYLKDHPGQWPHSWAELWANNAEHASTTTDSAAAAKPDPAIEADVRIDFTLSLDAVARQEAAQFTAVLMKEPRWQHLAPKATELILNVAREQLKRSKQTTTGPESK